VPNLASRLRAPPPRAFLVDARCSAAEDSSPVSDAVSSVVPSLAQGDIIKTDEASLLLGRYRWLQIQTVISIMPGAMGVDPVSQSATADPAYLGSLVNSYMPCSREGWAQFQPLYALTQAVTPQLRSEGSSSAYRNHHVSPFNLLWCVIRSILLGHLRQYSLSSFIGSVNAPQV
jgi:hypothetical protein